MQIREALKTDLNDVLTIERLAFGYDKEANLVGELLHDPSAKPLLSLLAFKKDRAVGHILFTAARLSGATREEPRMTSDTSDLETPARRATSTIVGRRVLREALTTAPPRRCTFRAMKCPRANSC